jgi:hypothetical protein
VLSNLSTNVPTFYEKRLFYYKDGGSKFEKLVPFYQTTAQKTAVFLQTKCFGFVVMPKSYLIGPSATRQELVSYAVTDY